MQQTKVIGVTYTPDDALSNDLLVVLVDRYSIAFVLIQHRHLFSAFLVGLDLAV
jgi:hypothetical protein